MSTQRRDDELRRPDRSRRCGAIQRRGPAAVALLMLAAAALGWAGPASAGSSWLGVKGEVFGSRPIEDGTGLVRLKVPFRPDDVRAVPVAVDAALTDGRSITSVSIFVDENPSPVAATFKVGGSRAQIKLATKVRLNQESFIRAVVEASDGRLYMASSLVRFAGGQSACSAPPTGDPAEIAANMGKARLAAVDVPVAASQITQRLRLDVRHPNHTGMALDQMTLLYIPLRILTRLDIRQGGEPVLQMAGSMTLSENPTLEFDLRGDGSDKLDVTLEDSDGATWRHHLDIVPAT